MPKVAIIKCESYDAEQVFNALKKGIALIGGIEKFIGKKDKVLLKPNLLKGEKPDKLVSPHPTVFEAIIRIFKEGRYDVFYGDSPIFGAPEKAAKQAGLKEVADRHHIKMGEFTTGQIIHYPAGKVSKQFEIAQAALEANSIISICKMKTHELTRITGAIKNQLGCVYGHNKAAFHTKFTDAISFSKMLVDLNMLLKPKLFIMDGIIAMEGNGPISGNSSKMNALLISNDPVALDATFCRMIDLNPEYVPSIMYGKEYGLGTWHENEIELLGEPLETFINKNFDVLRSPIISESTHNPVFTKTFRSLFLRKPVIDDEKCQKCGICVDVCPVEGKALAFKGDKSKPPVYNYSKCIRCYCCQETCPHKAISVKTPTLGKLLLYRASRSWIKK